MLAEPNCFIRRCAHFQGIKWLGDDETTEVPYCDAFPGGIPADIAYGENDHTAPVKWDNGIQYEKAKKWPK